MKRIFIFFAVIILAHEIAVCQTVLLHEKISDYEFEIPSRGPNFRHFTHLYLGFAFYIPQSNENQITTINGATTAFSVGFRYKYKINNFLALGAGLNYTNDIFSIKQSKDKVFPDTVIHKNEKLRFNSIGPDAFIRFNFGKRGNVIGRFIDFGVYYNWVFVARQVFKDNSDKDSNKLDSGKQKVVLSDLNYIRPFHYGVKTRVGINRFVFTASYRLDELLNEKCTPMFLPRLNVGIEVGLHK